MNIHYIYNVNTLCINKKLKMCIYLQILHSYDCIYIYIYMHVFLYDDQWYANHRLCLWVSPQEISGSQDGFNPLAIQLRKAWETSQVLDTRRLQARGSRGCTHGN